MKRFNKLLCFMVVFIAVMAAVCTVSFAATVGQSLTSPEAGWKRIDSSDSHFVSNWSSYAHTSASSGSYLYTGNNNDKLTFKFYGTKIRLIACMLYNNRVTTNVISIDGVVYNFSELRSPTNQFQSLVAEVTDLSLGVHCVEVYSTSLSTNQYIDLDAIDIETSAYLIDYHAPANLKASAGESKVDLTWDSVPNATGYIVKRSNAPGGPYTVITTTSAITYEDKPLSDGTTYYYIVTAIVNGVESSPSNEASATPTVPVVNGNPGILEITMNNGQIKEYALSGSEIQSFLTWYDDRSNGADKAYYIITKKNNIKPFLSRKEYISFDKISSFEVKEYTE